MTDRRIGIIVNGHVGSALVRGLTAAGYDATAISKEEERVRETVESAEIAILAVPFTGIDNVLKEAGGLFKGKTPWMPGHSATPACSSRLGPSTPNSATCCEWERKSVLDFFMI